MISGDRSGWAGATDLHIRASLAMEYLNPKEYEIIMELKTEYINLNRYLHHIIYHTDGTCQYCGVAETVSHFLLDCKGSSEAVASLHKDSVNYENARHQMRKRLKDIAIF